MSEGNANDTNKSASSDAAEVDDIDIELEKCDNFEERRRLIVQRYRRSQLQHEEACKKEMPDLRGEELLFKPPESSHLGDCPICMIPLSLDRMKSCMMTCCSKIICNGCDYASKKRAAEASRNPQHKCAFCRQPLPKKNEPDKFIENSRKRMEANDPVAICEEGLTQYNEGNYQSAFEYYTKAAELGDIEAHYRLSYLYQEGCGVEKDTGKVIHHLKEASIRGHPFARHYLGSYEFNNANIEIAVKHWAIAAAQGDDDSMKMMMDQFKRGFVTKDELATALRAHQAAVDATKSPQRDAAEEYRRNH